ncbi:rubredoxin, partial [Klebsiella pneumoniae]|uniref:rubredoxin n=1 Tax=Klebsiella pneumoniae TaxID=573 RepID=UPI00351E300D
MAWVIILLSWLKLEQQTAYSRQLSILTNTMEPEYKKYICVVCGFIYDEAEGWPEDGLA